MIEEIEDVLADGGVIDAADRRESLLESEARREIVAEMPDELKDLLRRIHPPDQGILSDALDEHRDVPGDVDKMMREGDASEGIHEGAADGELI